MNRADEIKYQIEILQRELNQIENGIVEVYGGERQTFPKGTKEIRVHMNPITHIEFYKDHIQFWDSETCFTINIIPLDTNDEFEINIVR